jgi:acetolactate synthase I/II/III large subunit
MPTGGELLIQSLATEGVTHVFTVPGESFIAALDAMHAHETVRPITCRHESGAAMMAEATGKLTKRPGVALVTRGPGAANALPGVYIAQQDATPLLLLVGLPPRAVHERPAFQSIDLAAVFGSLAKWCAIVPSAGRLQEFIARAVLVAQSGRAGPVVIGLPEDVLDEVSTDTPAVRATTASPISLSPATLDAIRTALAYAERPLVIAGGTEWTAESCRDLALFAERFELPVIAAFRRQDHIDNRHRCYAGHAGLAMDASLAAGLRASDCVIAIGTRLGDVTTQGFTLLRTPSQKLFHIAADAGAAGSPYPAAIAVPASPVEAIRALTALELPGKVPPWGIWRRDLRAAYEATLRPRTTPGNVRMEEVIAVLSQVLPETAIVTSGAGNYAAFLHRYFVYKSYPSQLAPVSGSMGYGLPAAIAAKLAAPHRTVVALAGDGCFQMTGQELATALQFGLPIVVILANNAALGTIRMHQERRYPGRVVATSLMNPDFVALARSYGAHAERVTATSAFPQALDRALACGRTAVIELAIDVDAISPAETITGLRARAATPRT